MSNRQRNLTSPPWQASKPATIKINMSRSTDTTNKLPLSHYSPIPFDSSYTMVTVDVGTQSSRASTLSSLTVPVDREQLICLVSAYSYSVRTLPGSWLAFQSVCVGEASGPRSRQQRTVAFIWDPSTVKSVRQRGQVPLLSSPIRHREASMVVRPSSLSGSFQVSPGWYAVHAESRKGWCGHAWIFSTASRVLLGWPSPSSV
ncbi:hypothetical protein G6O67_005872 [Ophiocordyceps sinensis]|uniref:Uncharacterized protein n=1 Tax=Ophiocordyceps sinensis TaxID=72228 RepID=A0A8H4LXA9_9HYPO|nr:hypothetical protein G6O67_005872 [Ophiocordyceps sinensis]